MTPFPIDPEKDTLCDVVRRWADVQPEAPAFLGEGKAPLSYGHLVETMDELHTSLLEFGYARGDRIAIVYSDGANMASLILGVISTASAVPLNPNFTRGEFRASMEAQKIDAVIIEQGLNDASTDAARDLAIPIIDVLEKPDNLAGSVRLRSTPPRSAPPPFVAPEHDDFALILATSGTTSASKIVPIRHDEFLYRQIVLCQHLGLARDDRYFHFRPMQYGNGANAIGRPLFSGGSTYYARDLSPRSFLEQLNAVGATWFNASPTFFKSLISEHSKGGLGPVKSRLRFAISSSSASSEDLLACAQDVLGCPVVEGMGIAEAGWLAVNPVEPGRAKMGTVGLPLCEARIRSPEGEYLPPRQVGEIVLRGPQVFKGYLDGGLSNSVTFADGWFRTGDEGFLDEDGYLTLSGRIKEMINRGGEKVSPAEVDAALISHPDVSEAATFPIPHVTLGEEVAAAVVARPGSALKDRDLARFLLDRLAGFKVPRRFVFVDEIPKTTSDKVQRFALAEALGVSLDPGAEQARKSNRRPSPLESRLQRLWRRALRVPYVGLDDNFFLLGGDSLQAVDLFLEIERSFKRRLPLAALFEAGTVAEMAVLIGERDMEPQGAVVPIQSEGDMPPFFCVHGAGGEAVTLYHLSKHLGPAQPFYGIQAVGWDTSAVPYTKADDMAAHYVAEMRKIQPHGPYHIGGQSFGGRIAISMARQLKEAGEVVGLLALFDTIFLAGRRFLPLGQWLARQGSPKGTALLDAVCRYVRFRLVTGYWTLYDRALRTVLFPVLELYRATGKSAPLPLCRPDRCNRLMLLEFRHMPSYEGDAVYFKAEIDRMSLNHPDTQDAWDRVIKGRLDYIPISGTHDRMMSEPHVRSLAQKLARELARARQAYGMK
jgi:acyl-CoA synthetase (AMP-forming)/AMP-acid ligase II/thioesterase domain-containing protein/acyl carrier protein